MKEIILLCIAVLFLIFGFGGFILTCNDFGPHFEYPLSTESIAVDNNSTIYCGLCVDAVIQVYDNHGRFLRSWKVDAGGGSFALDIDKSNHLIVTTVKNRKKYTYERDRTLLKMESDDEAINNPNFMSQQYYCLDNQGNEYKVVVPILYPMISKTDVRGSQSLIIAQPFYLWCFIFPIPSMLFGFGGIGLIAYLFYFKQD